jgi:hypothetical protein
MVKSPSKIKAAKDKRRAGLNIKIQKRLKCKKIKRDCHTREKGKVNAAEKSGPQQKIPKNLKRPPSLKKRSKSPA